MNAQDTFTLIELIHTKVNEFINKYKKRPNVLKMHPFIDTLLREECNTLVSSKSNTPATFHGMRIIVDDEVCLSLERSESFADSDAFQHELSTLISKIPIPVSYKSDGVRVNATTSLFDLVRADGKTKDLGSELFNDIVLLVRKHDLLNTNKKLD